MQLKITKDTDRFTELGIKKGDIYEIDEDQPIVINMWKIKVPKKQKGKFEYALVSEDEGELIG